MADIGYYEQIEGGVFGTANPATDSSPESRAALQEASVQLQARQTQTPGYVPPSYAHQALGVLPKVGWTCQNSGGAPPFEAWQEPVGRIPDWTSDPNPIGAGAYDMNQAVGSMPPNPLNRAPIGDGLLQFDDTQTNPNAPTTDVGCAGDLEY